MITNQHEADVWRRFVEMQLSATTHTTPDAYLASYAADFLLMEYQQRIAHLPKNNFGEVDPFSPPVPSPAPSTAPDNSGNSE